jgi:hypothetical protein
LPQNESEKGHVELFINKNKVSDPEVQNHFKENRVEVFEYDHVFERLKEITD